MRSVEAAGNPRSHRAWLACVLLAGVGLAVSAYLTGRAFASLAPSGSGGSDLCSALFARGCDGALAEARYWVLNIPVAGWGLVYFATLGGLLFLARFVPGAFEADALLAGLLVTLAGTGAGLALTADALLGRAPLCPLCLVVHGINLLLLPALVRAGGRIRRLRGVLSWLRPTGAPMPDPARWKLVGFAAVALLAAMAYQWVYVEAAIRRPAAARAPDRARVIVAYRATPAVAFPVTEQDPCLGPVMAPVQLVVFGSLECPAYRRFAGALARLRHEFRDDLLVVFKHYPLSTTCNGRLTADMQPGACSLAWAAEAARLQGRFWPFHDALLAGPLAPAESVAEAARRSHLDPSRFDADRRSDDARTRVAEDVALGNRLKIPGTPTVFLDGRRVGSVRREVLEILVRHELGPRAEGPSQNGRKLLGVGRLRHEDRPSRGG